MQTLIGLVGLAIFIPCVIAFAASITWLVVKISPTPVPVKQSETPSS